QRRRRRRRSRAQTAAGPGGSERPQAPAPVAASPRPWWRPTVAVVIAFSAGLWVGATLSFADTASGAALLAGALGMGLGGARLLSNKLRRDRLRAAREARELSDRER
ncbi:MAG: hypothetical protein OXI03_08440, partial [Chloroflexota bacterium]|nr:hypothetical protein [Chloroflexota bacterium]